MSDSQNNQFYQNDLDLNPKTLVLKHNLDMVKMYLNTKNEVFMSSHSKVMTQMDKHRHTDTWYEKITFPHMQTVIICRTIFSDQII